MIAYPVVDSMTMLRRSLRRMRRYPSLTFFIAALPIIFLLLFTFVLGGAMGAGLGAEAPAGGRDAYLAYVVPGILVLTVAGAGTGTAISVSMDMTNGIIARFRTMAIARASVLTGHVLGTVIQVALASLLVVAVAVVIGFRPTTGPLAWLAAAGLIVVTSVAIAWLSVAMGLVTDSVETASNLPQVLLLVMFLSSALVPIETLPQPLLTIAQVNPFTAIVETVRGLLLGTEIGNYGLLAVAWSVGFSVVGFLWATRLYGRDVRARA